MENGKDLKLYVNEECVAASKSCTFRYRQETIDKIPQNNWSWESKLPGKQSFEVTCTGLATERMDLETLISGKTIWFTLDNAKTNDHIAGYAYVKSIVLSATKGKAITYEVSLEGTDRLYHHYGYTELTLNKFDAINSIVYAEVQDEIDDEHKILSPNTSIFIIEDYLTSNDWIAFTKIEGEQKYVHNVTDSTQLFMIGTHGTQQSIGKKVYYKIVRNN